MKFDSIEEKVIYEKLVHGNGNIGVPFAGSSKETFTQNLDRMRQFSHVSTYYTITSHRPIIGPFIVFGKRLVRKLLKWYVERVCQMQSEFNAAAVDEIKNLETSLAAVRQQQIAQAEQLKALSSWVQEKEKTLINPLNGGESHSQSGEDVIASYMAKGLGIPLKECTYLDLGANHAKILSNTYFFYQQGARGVLVEANPDLIPELKKERPGDVVLNRCVSLEGKQENLHFYILNGDGLSTTDKESAMEAIRINPKLAITKEVDVGSITMQEIIRLYFPKAPVIMNIDIEGQEMGILNSIPFDSWRPAIIIMEMIDYSNKMVVGQKDKEKMDFMKAHGYVEYANTGINSLFIDDRLVKERLS
jgi:FkbM family methyltransferase